MAGSRPSVLRAVAQWWTSRLVLAGVQVGAGAVRHRQVLLAGGAVIVTALLLVTVFTVPPVTRPADASETVPTTPGPPPPGNGATTPATATPDPVRASDRLGFTIPRDPVVAGSIKVRDAWFWRTPTNRVQVSVTVAAAVGKNGAPARLAAPDSRGGLDGAFLVWCGPGRWVKPSGTTLKAYPVPSAGKNCVMVPATPNGRYWGTGDGYGTWATSFTSVTVKPGKPVVSKNRDQFRLSFFTPTPMSKFTGWEPVAIVWYLPRDRALVSPLSGLAV
jgi:hypothetical protein